jgi:acetyl/propionyl-CoA carboxylase alpha subunit
VTEEVTGLDLVVAQFEVAAGGDLPWRQDEIVQRSAAVECRIYAEDPARRFLPSPGVITRLALPDGDGVRVESGVVEGSAVTVHYDPLLLKVVTVGAGRDAAVARMRDALDVCEVSGVQTTLPLLRRVVRHEAFVRGAVHTQMVEQGAFNG